jgi:hypothetical protein
MIDPCLGLRHAEVDHVIAVVRVHALDPVVDAHPTVLLPAKQPFDLRTDVTEGHALPINPPRDGLGRFKQGFVDVAVGID